MIRASIVIPHYNDVDRLPLCLAALAPQLVDDVEAIVVDNASTQDLSAVRTAFPSVRFVTETRRGAAAARNRGVDESSGAKLFFLDCDCIPAADWVATALEVVERADVTGGRIDTFDETPPPRSGAEAFEAVFAFNQRRYVEEERFSVTANLLTDRDWFSKVGRFADGVSEDKDWCLRAVAIGARLVYADTLVVRHPTRPDWTALKKKWRRLTDEAFQLQGAGAKGRALWAVRAFAVGASPIVHLPKVLRSPSLSSFAERRRAAATLFALRAQRAAWMLGQSLGLFNPRM